MEVSKLDLASINIRESERVKLKDAGRLTAESLSIDEGHKLSVCFHLQDIGGNDIQKQEIKEAVELPLTHHELYRQIGIDPPRGVLLWGPPGTGKTMLAKAVAHHTTAAFIRVVGSEFVQKYLGEVRLGIYPYLSNFIVSHTREACESYSILLSILLVSFLLWETCWIDVNH